MRAAVLHPDCRVSVTEIDPPSPAPGQIVVAPLFVGLCGSDVSYATKGANGAFAVRHPMVLGHEICAILTEPIRLGDEVVPAGVAVVVHPLWPSPLRGESAVRTEFANDSTSFLGSASTLPHTNGGLAELLAVRPEQVRRVPDGLPPARAVLAEPLAVVLHALGRLPVAVAGRRVLVCGAGPIGLLTALCLKDRGTEVTLTDLHRRPLDLALELGADHAIQVPGETPEANEYDIVIEATGAPASFHTALNATAVGGHVLQLGMLSRDPSPTVLAPVVTKELTVTGTHRFVGELDAAIDFLAGHPACDRIITHRLGLESAAEALALAADAANASKVVVEVR